MFKKRNKIIYNYIANICTDLKCNGKVNVKKSKNRFFLMIDQL